MHVLNQIGFTPVLVLMWGATALGPLPAHTHEGVVSLRNKPHTASFFASYNLRHKAAESVPTGGEERKEEEGLPARAGAKWTKC